MNRPRSILAFSTALLLLFATFAGASDVTLYSVYKRQLYFQFGAGSPTPPSVEDFRFFSLVQITSSTNASSASVTPPGGSGQALSANFNNAPYPPQFSLGSTSYTSQAALDGAWPNGIYFYDIATANDGVKRLQLTLTGNNYPVAPHISNHASAQAIIPSTDFTLTWDAMTGGTTNDYIQLEVNTGNTVNFFSPLPPVVGALDGTATSVVIPANSLAPSTTYTARLRFFKATTRESTSYPGALAAAAYNRDTIFNLTTVATPGAPTIAQQPISQTHVVGNSATFRVTATGTAPLTYQWRKDGTNLVGATNYSYTVSNLQTSDAGGYTVVVSDSGVTTTSANATLTVNLLNAPLEIGTVLAWGYNNYGQTAVPSGLSRVMAVAAGRYHTVALRNDGTVAAWGDNTYGQTSVPAALSGVTAIAAGRYNTLALKSDGTVTAWGYRSAVPAGLNGVTAVAAGYAHRVALNSDGTVTAWGVSDARTSVPVGLSGVTAIAAGDFHTVALKSDGTVVAWGLDGYGSVYGGIVPVGLTGVVAIAAGFNHTVALKSDGTVLAWGTASGGTTVPVGLAGVVAIAAGDGHTVALKSDGTVAAWGDNNYGETTVPVGLSGVTAIAAGASHTVVVGVALPSITTQPQSQSVGVGADVTLSVAATGTVPMGFQWRKDGTNLAGATGSAYTIGNVQTSHAGSYAVIISNVAGSVTSAPPAVLTVALTPTIAQQPVNLTALVGQTRTFYATVNGAAPLTYQWRKDGVNLAGATSATLSLSNVLTNHTGNYLLVVTNAYGSVTSSVAVLTVNRLPQTFSFGSFPAKRLDDAPFTLSATASSGLPVSYASFNPSVVTVSGNTVAITGFGTTIITASQVGDATYLPSSVGQAILVAMPGTVVAWGANGVDYYGISYDHGQTTVPAGLSEVVAIAAGDGHSVALKGDGSVVAWGWNAYSQSTIPDGLNGVTAIAAGWYHTVALKSNGTVVAWGYNGYGATTVPAGLSGVMAIAAGRDFTVALKNDGTVVAWGSGTTATGVGVEFGQSMVPVGLSGVMAIAAGHAHTVALKSDGTVVAWGDNRQGQTNVSVGLSGVTAIAAGGDHTVALKSDGTVVARGYNFYGQTTVPAGVSGVTAIEAGYYHTVALKRDGTVVAWGYNYSGQTTVPAGLGSGSAIAAGGSHTVALVPVLLPSITAQPTSLLVLVTSNATFSVTATGIGPFTYEWFRDGALISGAMGSTYTITNAQTNDAGGYTVVVRNVAGSVTSAPPAVLTVNVPPSITQQPVDQTVVAGNSVAFSVIASGPAPLTYQWRKDGTNLNGATGNSYTLANAQANHAGSYTVVVSNAGGSVTSAPPAVLVVGVPPTITQQPQSQTVQMGVNASFTVAATGTAPLNYQWRKSGSPVTGATSATFTLSNVQPTDTSTYDVVVTNLLGSATSSAATLVVTTNSFTNLVLSVGGSGQYGTVPSSPAIQPSNAITIELWFLPLPNPLSNPIVLNKGDGQTVSSARSYQVNWSSSSGVSFHLFLGASTYAPIYVPAPVNTWVHLAATYDSATSRINIFTNGILAASTTNDEGGSPLNGQRLRQTTLPLTFGFAPVFASTYFKGSIDEVRIWNFARSGAEISRDFHARLAGTEPGLVGYWQFDGGSVADMTTNANNGSLVGGAQIVAITGADIPHIGAPTIPQASQNLAVAPGTNVTFTVAATSIAPLSYQWFKDGVLIADQTNAQLNLSGLTNRARGGSFSVMVSNLYGAITGNIGSIRVRVPHRLQPPVATNGMFRLLSADQDGGLLTTNDLAFFTFQTSTNLTPTNWLSITYTNGLSLTNGMLRFDDTNAASRPFRYYRVIEQ